MFKILPEGLETLQINFFTNMLSLKIAVIAHGRYFVFQYYS